MPTAQRKCGGALQDFCYPLNPGHLVLRCLSTTQSQCGGKVHDFRCIQPPSSVAVHCNIVTAKCQ